MTVYLSPKYFFEHSALWIPWIAALTLGLFAVGLWGGLVLAPPDWQQGDAFRIIYVHVPSALFLMGVYVAMAVASAIFLIWRVKMAYFFATAAAPIGAVFTLLALITGAIWGKPMWGTWWTWGDARLVSELILLFLYIGVIGLNQAITTPQLAGKASSLLAIVGVVNIPIIHYSVIWWNTLHQPPTISKLGAPSITADMAVPLFFMLAAFGSYFILVLLLRMRNHIAWSERNSEWVKAWVLR